MTSAGLRAHSPLNKRVSHPSSQAPEWLASRTAMHEAPLAFLLFFPFQQLVTECWLYPS